MSDNSNNDISLLLVVSNAATFDSQVNFLRRRGWSVHMSTTLRDAIEFIANHGPDFVLISVNHPNPKVVKMPQIISQTFNCRSVLIGESLDTQTAAALTKSGWRDVIHAPVSGPGIQLRIKQIVAREKQESSRIQREAAERAKINDLKKQTTETQENTANSNQAPEGTRTPSIAEQIAQRAQQASQKQNSGVAYMPSQASAESAAGSANASPTAIQSFGTQDADSGSPSDGSGSTPSTSPVGAQIHASKSKKEAAAAPGNPFADLPVVAPEVDGHSEFEFTAAGTTLDLPPKSSGEGVAPGVQQGGPNSPPVYYNPQEDEKGNGSGDHGPGHYNPQTSQSTFAKPEKGNSGKASVTPPQSESEMDAPKIHGQKKSAVPEGQEAEDSNTLQEPLLDGSQSSKKNTEFQATSKSPKPISLTSGIYDGADVATILRIIRESFEDSVQTSGSLTFRDEKLYFDTYFISVESVSGFLVYTSKNKFQIESHLVPKINTRILEGLKQGGFTLGKMQNVEATHLGEMELSINSLHEASLMSLVSGMSDEDSLVLSFLDISKSKNGLIYDEEKQMIGFPVEFIPANVKSPFQVFLYLPVNKKYYLYLNEGNSFSDKQIEKLGVKGVKHLFVKQQEQEKLDDFFLSKHLADSFKKSS